MTSITNASMCWCTTIIETGIDIPTANTIIIERADHFGLAQLHQLRGRVGRSHHQAYAWLLTRRIRKAMTTDAQKRLEAIASLEDLGAGFALATHDLEIRGAGELLGKIRAVRWKPSVSPCIWSCWRTQSMRWKAGREPSLEDLTSQQTEVELRMPSCCLMISSLTSIRACHSISALPAPKRTGSGGDQSRADRSFWPPARCRPQPAGYRPSASAGAETGDPQTGKQRKGGVIEFNEKNNVNPVWLIGLLQKQPQHFRLDGPTRLKFMQDLEERKTRMDWVRQFMRQLEENAVA